MSCNILLISNKGNLLGEHANIAFYYCIKNNLFAIKLTFFFLMVLLQVLMLIYMQNLKPDCLSCLGLHIFLNFLTLMHSDMVV